MYLFSNIVGTFVFNQNYKIREKVLYSDEESLEAFKLLKEGKEIPGEKRFLDKFKNIKKVPLSEEILPELEQFEEELYRKNIFITQIQVKESVTTDNMVVQAINTIEELEKSINLLTKRYREWYAFYLPEIEATIKDNEHILETIHKPRKELLKEFGVKSTMGADLEKIHIDELKELAKSIKLLKKEKETKEKYLDKIMESYPNLKKVAGSHIGAQLIKIGGSLRDLVMMPASTIQLLGAEKALFRHMKTGARPPRHGVIVHHPLISTSPDSEHGKRARTLADKISMAVKVDFFKGDYIGDKLVKELEEKFS